MVPFAMYHEKEADVHGYYQVGDEPSSNGRDSVRCREVANQERLRTSLAMKCREAGELVYVLSVCPGVELGTEPRIEEPGQVFKSERIKRQ